MLNIYSNGITMGLPPSVTNHPKALRGDNVGWSESSTRANTKFLYSVDAEQLTGHGYAFTLTLRDLPPNPHEMYLCRSKFIRRVQRMGLNLIRYHWVMEWQRRGVPHLHGCLYFDQELSWHEAKAIKKHWCESVGQYHALQKAQDIKPIESAVGWLKYLAKHGSRSKYHYQRSQKPSEWKSSGRVWGKGGEWPQRLTECDLGLDMYHTMRRLVKRWRIADARKPQPVEYGGYTLYPDNPLYWKLIPNGHHNGRRIAQARRCLKVNKRNLSIVRGMSEWVSEKLAYQMLEAAEYARNSISNTISNSENHRPDVV